MEVLVFFALVAFLIVLINFKSKVGKNLEELKLIVLLLRDEMQSLKKAQDRADKSGPEVETEQETIPQPTETIEKQPEKSLAVESEKLREDPVYYEKEVPVMSEFDQRTEEINEPVPLQLKERKPGFFERNPDLEKFIGENLINKIGIAILVLGIGFFVKYAIDQEWINQIGRVVIGLSCGVILLGFAHKLRNSYKAFGSVLVGGGMAIFYFTIYIGFHTYGLFQPKEVAFIVMVLITAFSVFLSILYNRKEIAALAIIGGFIAPFLVSTGEGNYIALFTYISVLNIGMLVLAYYKSWNLINLLSYLFTILLFGIWLFDAVSTDDVPVIGGLIFATLFYITFFLMNIINNIRENRKFLGFHLTMLISNTFLYFTAGMILLDNFHDGAFRGLFTSLIAIFNFGFAYTLYKNRKVDLNLAYLLIGLTLTFISLAAPVQLKGNYITLFWAVEAVLLLWLSQKSGIMLMKLGALLIMALMIISLVIDWYQIYEAGGEHMTMIVNKGFVTSMVALFSIQGTLYLLRNEGPSLFKGLETSVYRFAMNGLFIILLYFGLLLELMHQVSFYIDSFAFRNVIIGSYNMLFIIGCLVAANKAVVLKTRIAATLLGVLGMVVFVVTYHSSIIQLRNAFLSSGDVAFSSYLYHYVLTALVIFIIYLTFRNVRSIYKLDSSVGKLYLWFAAIITVFILSAELDHLIVLNSWTSEYGNYPALTTSHKIGYPLLWGICSFVLMIAGMKYKIKTIRIISLTLFFITLTKLFLFDIRGISEGGKIAAFICLGILLLIVSFMYQKLKNLILEGEVKTPEE